MTQYRQNDPDGDTFGAMLSEPEIDTGPLEQAVAAIKSAESLYDLHRALIDFEIANDAVDDNGDTEGALRFYGIDICELPIFGGPMPKSTSEVWSWDEDYLLVGVGSFQEWEIRERVA